MNIALRKPRMTREEFFAWAQAQDVRYEFDGFEPVAMTGGTVRHNRICQNLHFALRTRLRGTRCEPLGPDAGVATVGDAVRYPDALVTCTKAADATHLVPGVIIVFEVLSPTSGRIDRIVKLREYQAVPSIRRYVIVEHGSADLIVFERRTGDEAWTATAQTVEDILRLPEVGIEIPVTELYENTGLARGSTGGDTADDPAAQDASPDHR